MKPYLLKEYQNRWYVVGIVAGINELRTFGLERIEALEVCDEIFKADLKLNPSQKFDDAIGLMFSISKKEKVVLSFSPSQGCYIKSLPMHHSQKVLVDNELECRIELNVVVNYELIQQILMHHSMVKVLEPCSLVDEMKRLLQEALAQY